MGSPVAGPKSELLTLTRADRERRRGSPALYCYGYLDLLEAFGGDDVWPIVEAVVDETLNPLSVLELALCADHGLDAWVNERERGSLCWRRVTKLRPTPKRETAKAKPPHSEPFHGLGDLWALSTADLAAQLELAERKPWTATTSEKLQMWLLPSIIKFSRAQLTDDVVKRLGIKM